MDGAGSEGTAAGATTPAPPVDGDLAGPASGRALLRTAPGSALTYWFRWTSAVVVGGYALVLFALPVPGAVRVLQAGLLVQATLQAVAALGQRPGHRLLLHDEGLELRGPLRRRRVAWADVTAVHGDAPGGRARGTRVVVERRGGRDLVLPPLGVPVEALHALLVEHLLDDRARRSLRSPGCVERRPG